MTTGEAPLRGQRRQRRQRARVVTSFAYTAALLSSAGALAVLSPTASAQAATATSAAPAATPVCAAPAPGHVTCYAERAGVAPMTAGVPAGYGPSDLQSAYQLPSASGGVGQTVYIVDAYDLSTAEADLAAYRAQYGLPDCTTANGCFHKVNGNGAASPLPGTNASWGQETALDMDMVSAVCPQCSITLVEASDTGAGMYTAVSTAVRMGAKFVSMSWGGPEFSGETIDDSVFAHPGVLFAASTGDKGFAAGPSYPAVSPNVLAVGGTALTRDSSARGWTESAWGSASGAGAGSGCSVYEAKPTRQSIIPNQVCAGRVASDVSAVADPNTGVAVYRGGWLRMGGTSASAPIISGIYALAGLPGANDAPQTYPYTNTTKLNDPTTGTTGTCGTLQCNADTGWDGPTGLGTPIGIGAFNGTGSDTPAVNFLGANLSPIAATAGLPAIAAVTPIVPTGHSLASVAWTAAKGDCTFADPAALSTTVTCNAADSGSTKVTVTLVDSAGATKAVTTTMTFSAVPATKRATSISFTLDGQSGSAVSTCTGNKAPAVAHLVDVATGAPIKGVSVAFTKKTLTQTTAATTAATAVSTSDGSATAHLASTVALIYGATTKVTGSFAAATGNMVTLTTPATCTPSVSAALSSTTAWMNDSVTASGTVTRSVAGSTLPLAGVPVALTLQGPSTTSSTGKVTTPAPVSLGTATTDDTGRFTISFKATKPGSVSAVVKASTMVSAASAALGSLTVTSPTTAITGSYVTPAGGDKAVYGETVNVTGQVNLVRATTTGYAKVPVRLLEQAPGATTFTTLASGTTAADGSFALKAIVKATGLLRVSYPGATGIPAANADLGTLTVISWTPAVTLHASATSVALKGKVTYTGTLTKTGLAGAVPAAGVAVKLIEVQSSGKTVTLGSATTKADGSFTSAIAMAASGSVTAQVVKVAGYADASSTAVHITVG